MFSGKDIVAVDSPIGRLGLSVCYDLRFPELYQLLRFQHGAQVLDDSVAFLLKIWEWIISSEKTGDNLLPLKYAV
jgi:hypothetical protein